MDRAMGPEMFQAEARSPSSKTDTLGTHAARWPRGSGFGSCVHPCVWRERVAASQKVQAGEVPFVTLTLCGWRLGRGK